MQKTSNFFRITLIYFISLVLFVGLRIFFQYGLFSGMSSNLQDIISTVLIQIVIMFLVPFLFYMLFYRKNPKLTFKMAGFKKITFRAVLISLAIGLIAFFLNIVVSSIFNGFIQSIGFENNSSSSGAGADYSILAFFINVLCVAILPAICEEFLHRGLLMRNLFNSVSVKHALIISSICFGLMHLNIVQVFYATILGLLIGFVSIVGKSIWPAIIIHFVNNFINVYLSFAKNNGWVFGNFYELLSNFISNNWILSLITIMVVISVLLFLLLKLIMDLLKITSFESFKKVVFNIKKTLNKDVVNYNTQEEVQETQYINDVEPILVENIVKTHANGSLFMPDIYNKEKLIFKDKIFIIATFFLGVFITLSTFIWGIL